MTNAVIEKLAPNLRSPIVNAPSTKAGRYLFRGELGLKYPDSVAGEIRPPLVKVDQVIFTTDGDSINFLACRGDTLAYLEDLIETTGSFLSPTGKYFFFASNVSLDKKFKLERGGATFYVLPLDEATVYNELLDVLYIERSDLKKLSSEAKVDAIAETAFTANFDGNFKLSTWEVATAEMGPTKVVENRPV